MSPTQGRQPRNPLRTLLTLACHSRNQATHASTPLMQERHPRHPRQHVTHASTPPMLARIAQHFSNCFKTDSMVVVCCINKRKSYNYEIFKIDKMFWLFFKKRKLRPCTSFISSKPSIIESSFIVVLQLQTEMWDAVDTWIISKYLSILTLIFNCVFPCPLGLERLR